MLRFTFLLLAFILIVTQNVFGVDRKEEHIFDSLYDKAWDIVEEDGDLSISYDISEKLLDISIRNKNTGHIIISFYLQGYILQNQKYYDQAAEKFFIGLDYLEVYKGPYKQLYETNYLQNLGYVYEKTYSLNNAIKYYKESLQIAVSNGYENVRNLNYNLGVVYSEVEEYEKALMHYQKALKETSENTWHYRAKIYNSIGNLYLNEGKNELAKKHYLKAIALQKKTKSHEVNLAYYISNLGEIFFKQEQFTESIDYYEKALKISKNHSDLQKMQWLYSNLGDAYFALENYQKAIEQFEKSIALGNPEVNDPEYKRALRNIIKAYQQIGAFKKALYYQELQTQAKLLEQKSQYKVKEVELVVENESSKQKLDSIASEKSHFITIIIGVFMSLNCLLLIAFAYYKGRPFLKRVFSSKP